MMMKLIKFPFKILALPLMLGCFTVSLLVKLLTILSCYVIGPLMLFLLGCGIYTITKGPMEPDIHSGGDGSCLCRRHVHGRVGGNSFGGGGRLPEKFSAFVIDI